MKNNDLDPTPQEWLEFKKQLPKFFKEACQFIVVWTIVLMFATFVMYQIIKLLYNIL